MPRGVCPCRPVSVATLDACHPCDVMSEIPGVSSTSSPREIGDAVARYLVSRLTGGPWQITAKGLKATQGDQTTEIRMRRLPRPTQTGVGVWFEPMLAIRDRSLRAWRRQHPDLATNQDDRMGEWTFSGLGPKYRDPVVLTTDDPEWVSIASGRSSIDDLVLHLNDWILPIREYLRSPSGLLSLPDPWIDAGWLVQLVEFAVARGEPDVTMPLLARTRWLEHPGFKRGRELALAGKHPVRDWPLGLGYRIAKLGLHYDLGTARSET
jgi:hypothetical protein